MKTLADQLWFEAVNQQDSHDRFQISAESEWAAKMILLDKLGYGIRKSGDQYILYDIDDNRALGDTEATSYERAVDAVLKLARWKIQEPTLLVGGETKLNDDADFVA